jgi:hypothetical protein
MKRLTKIQTIRFTEEDIKLMNELEKYHIKPDQFLRLAFREKIQRDLPIIIKEEEKRKSKDFCPF